MAEGFKWPNIDVASSFKPEALVFSYHGEIALERVSKITCCLPVSFIPEHVRECGRFCCFLDPANGTGAPRDLKAFTHNPNKKNCLSREWREKPRVDLEQSNFRRIGRSIRNLYYHAGTTEIWRYAGI